MLLASAGDRTVVCDVGGLAKPDAVVVDALGRLQLTARRLGARVSLRDACDELIELLELSGLRDVLPELGVEPRRQAEEWEPPGRVEEEAQPTDPIA